MVPNALEPGLVRSAGFSWRMFLPLRVVFVKSSAAIIPDDTRIWTDSSATHRMHAENVRTTSLRSIQVSRRNLQGWPLSQIAAPPDYFFERKDRSSWSCGSTDTADRAKATRIISGSMAPPILMAVHAHAPGIVHIMQLFFVRACIKPHILQEPIAMRIILALSLRSAVIVSPVDGENPDRFLLARCKTFSGYT